MHVPLNVKFVFQKVVPTQDVTNPVILLVFYRNQDVSFFLAYT